MTAKAILVAVVTLLALLIAFLNWEALMAQQALNLLVVRPVAPLGLILLISILVLSGLYLVLAFSARYRTLKRYRDYEARLQALQAELERARFEALESLEGRLVERFHALEKRSADLAHDALESVRGGQAQLEARLLQVRNELASDLAELEKAVRGGQPR